MTLNQISPSSFSAPTDVTLKLPDGNIDAHKMILAAVSPVFEKMFYGDFKEGKSVNADLPADSYNIFKLLIDFIYNGNCELECMDDILPIMEVMDRYQMKKDALCHTCSKVVLAKLDSSNYLTLLPKFVDVLNEEGINRAADKVMCYTDCSFIDKFDQTKNLPEEILLPLLQRNDISNPEIDIFNFLTKWHDYQTKELTKSLRLVPQLFQCIRYFLINPHLLLTKVIISPFVEKHLLTEAIDYLYQGSQEESKSSCKCGECNGTVKHTIRRPRSAINIISYWLSNDNVKYSSENTATVFWGSNTSLSPQPLQNGSYAFTIQIIHNAENFPFSSLSLNIHDSGNVQCNVAIKKANVSITILVYDEDVFLKIVDDAHVVSNSNIIGKAPFKISITGRCSSSGATLKIQTW